MLHRTRHLFIRQRTAVINAIRAHLAEFGIVAPVGRRGVEQLLDIVADASDKRLPETTRSCVAALGAQLRMLKTQILQFDRQIMAWHRSNETSKRLDAIPGVGPPPSFRGRRWKGIFRGDGRPLSRMRWMMLHTHNRMIVWGFGLCYAAVIESLVATGAPLIQDHRGWFFATMVVLGIAGGSLITVSKSSQIDDEKEVSMHRGPRGASVPPT